MEIDHILIYKASVWWSVILTIWVKVECSNDYTSVEEIRTEIVFVIDHYNWRIHVEDRVTSTWACSEQLFSNLTGNKAQY